MNTAVYIGAGTLLEHLEHIDANKIVCIDGQPFSEFGKMASWSNESPFCCLPPIPCWFQRNGFSRSNFIQQLKESAKACGLQLIKKEVNKYTFKNEQTNQTIIYFINTAFPDDYDRIADEILDFKHLIVMGYDPHSEIMKFTSNMVTFWANTYTVYQKDPFYDQFASEDGDDKDVIYQLNYNDDFKKYFNSFNLIRFNGEIEKFNSWDELLEHPTK
tara:strand:- start:192 stop:839 length:648 start_codon:yes stop_codon:yes gene_type:complete